ncbi:MAG: hypothetical protein HOV68_24020 [Streptomycetaceae bacterium]|nr:hypothetical protein [Streptomycetaceae bacterium]
MDSDHDQYTPASAPAGRSPWVTTAATGVVAAVVAGLLIATSGSGSGTTSIGDGPPGMPPLPGDLPTELSTRPPTKAPTGTAAPTRPGAPSSASASPSPTNDWNTASGDKKPFSAAEWFDATGPLTIQGRPYNQLAQDKTACSAAEPGLRSLFGAECLGIIRSLWTDSAKKYAGSMSVVSVTDKRVAQSAANRLSAGGSNGEYVAFIPPPSGSGVRFSEQYRTWVGAMPSGHYLVIVEIARTDGAAPDSGAKTMYDDLFLVAQQHINAVTIWGA